MSFDRVQVDVYWIPNIANRVIFIFLLSCLSGCSMTIIEEPITEEMLIQGTDLAHSPVSEGKALVEFTTNVSIPVSLATTMDNMGCSSRKLQPIGTATKAFDPNKPEDGKRLNGNVRYLKGVGNMKFAARPISPEKVYFYVDAGRETTFTSRAQMSSSNGYSSNSHSCGPVMMKFSPTAGRQYRFEFVGQDDKCLVQLQKLQKTKDVRSEEKYATWTCKNSSDDSPPVLKSISDVVSR